MSERLEAVITARDNASATFKKVGDAAETMGKDIESSAKNSGRSLKELEQDAKSVGLGIGAMIGTLAVAGQSFRDQEIALSTLRRTYGDAATDLEAFSQALAENSNYSEEAIISAANVAATLSRNYGATAAEIQQILQISADLAATSGFTLEDASQRVVAALRGEAEAAEQLGLTMNQQAIDRNNLTLSMSNQEAFQFRLNALTEQSAFAMGAASEQADTMYGAMTDIEDSVRNAGQAVAGFSPELAGMGAYLAENALQVAGLSLAVGQLGRAAMASRSLLASVGVSLGPVGLVAATAAAVGGILLLSDALQRDLPQASEEAIQSIETLEELIIRLGEQGRLNGAALEMAAAITEISNAVREGNAFLDTSTEDLAVALEMLSKGMGDVKTGLGETIAVNDEYLTSILGLTDAQIALINTNGDEVISLEEVRAAYEGRNDAITKAQELNAALLATMDEAQTIMAAEGEAAAYAQQAYANLTAARVAGWLTTEEYIAAIEQVAAELQAEQVELALTGDEALAYADKTNSAAQSALALADALSSSLASAGRGSMGLYGLLSPWEAWLESQKKGHNELQLEIGETQIALADALSGSMAAASASGGLEGWSAGLASIEAVMGEMGHTVQNTRGSATGLASDFHGLGAAMLEALPTAEDMATAMATAFENLQNQFTATTDALDAGFQTAVGQTNAWSQQSQNVADWAEELIAARGVYSALDDLVAAGRISGTSGVFDDGSQYAMAQQAHDAIMLYNEAIQEHVQVIQAKQAPAMAELMEQQEAYLQTLADAPAEQQTFALAMMDSATAAQALGLAQAFIGDQDTFGPMVQQAAELNPYLASILEQMGIISIGADGTITLNGEGAKSEMALLQESIDNLTETLWMIYMGLDDDASGPLGVIERQVNGLDGRVATVYIDTINRSFTISGVSGQASASALGGVIDAYGLGGTTRAAELAEWGGELLRLGHGGGVAMATHRGIYDVPVGTYVSPSGATRQTLSQIGNGITVNVNVTGDIYDTRDLAEAVSAEIVPAMQRALATRERGF